MKFLTPFGQPFAEQICKRLESVERLDRHVAMLKEQRYECTHVGLSRVEFTYSKVPQLSAEVKFTSDGDLPARLRLLPPDSNPHLRIRALLEHGLNSNGNNGFEAMTHVLKATLPLLQTFERLEGLSPGKETLSVHSRGSTAYTLSYRLPLPRCSFQIKARARKEGDRTIIRWHIQELRNPRVTGFTDELTDALKQLWRGRGEHWEGIGSSAGNGIIAEAQGVAQALEKIDEVVRRFEGVGETAPNASEGTEKATTETAIAQATAQAQPPPATKAQAPPASQPSKFNSAQQATKPIKKEPDVIMLD